MEERNRFIRMIWILPWLFLRKDVGPWFGQIVLWMEDRKALLTYILLDAQFAMQFSKERAQGSFPGLLLLVKVFIRHDRCLCIDMKDIAECFQGDSLRSEIFPMRQADILLFLPLRIVTIVVSVVEEQQCLRLRVYRLAESDLIHWILISEIVEEHLRDQSRQRTLHEIHEVPGD